MSTYSLNKGAVKTATTRVLAFISFVMSKYDIQEVEAVEEYVLKTNPASTLMFANALADNHVSPSSVVNILLDLERWSEYAYAELGTSSKYCDHHSNPPN